MNARRGVGLAGAALIAVLAAWLLWPSDPAAPAPEPPRPLSPPVEVRSEAVAANPPRVPAPEPMDAGRDVQAKQKPHISVEFRLDKNGALFSLPPPVETDWQRTCRREALACAARHPLWLSVPHPAFTLETTEFGTRVTGLFHPSSDGESGFMQCLEGALKLLQLPRLAQRQMACNLFDLRTMLNDPNEVGARLAGCLAPNAQTRSITASWDLVVTGSAVEVENVRYEFEGPIDTLAERCARSAVSTGSVRFSEKPPFTREGFEVRIITRNGTFASSADRLFPPLDALPPLTEEQRQRGEDLLIGIRRAQEEGETRVVLTRAAACIKAVPRFPTCYRFYGSASAKLVTDGPEGHDQQLNAIAGYKRFVELASDDDPYRAKVQALLTAAGE